MRDKSTDLFVLAACKLECSLEPPGCSILLDILASNTCC